MTITEIRKALNTCTEVCVFSILQNVDYDDAWTGYIKTTKTEMRSTLRGWDRNDTICADTVDGVLYLG